ncbi:AmMst-1 [Pilatotrama ljubarskyi]|nr:AmMst-1 [Pilatotrama ljubarskyi]
MSVPRINSSRDDSIASAGATRIKAGASRVVMTAFAAFGGILFGYDTGTISGILQMDDWMRTFGEPDKSSATGYSVSTSRESLIVSILSAGTFLGALAGAIAADILGRRMSILLSCVVFCLGVSLQTAGTNLVTFVVGRFFAGLGVGLISTLAPMYQAECAPKSTRGALVSCYQWAITVGLLLAAIVNNATKDRPDHSSWRISISIQLVWAAILFIGMLWLPETPRWLILKNRKEQAVESMSRLRALPIHDPTVQNEVDEMVSALQEELVMGQGSYVDCFRSARNKIALRTFTSITLQACQQLTGINFITYYGITFFASAGVKDPFLVQIGISIVATGMTFIAMWVVDRCGRRPLLIGGAAVMCLCEFLIAILALTIFVENVAGHKALIGLVCIYDGAFAATWGPVAWVVTGEIFPLKVRAKGIALSAASNWLWNWALAFATPYLVNNGPGDAGLSVKVFFLWGSTCAGCLVFAYFCIPETKGLSLEQVDLLYQNSTPLTSPQHRRQLVTCRENIPRCEEGPGEDKCPSSPEVEPEVKESG